MTSKSLRNRAIMSLGSGGQIGLAIEPVINPHNLKILGWWCKLQNRGGESVLLAEDVRENMPGGLAVNDETSLSAPADLARHREILNLRFHLIDKPVKTKRQKLGKVSDYTYDESMFIQKLYVARSLARVFSTEDTLIVDRGQILEVTDNYILVDDADVKATEKEALPVTAVAT